MSSPQAIPALVTVAVLAYNQRDYIRQAVESIFQQTYTPLEILLSDDGSTDGTAEIIAGLCDGYRGPHAIRVNLNHANEGIAAHVNRLFHMARGQLVVLAAGDDVSRADRVATLVSAWQRRSPQPWAIHSAATVIDCDGNIRAVYHSRLKGCENDVKRLIMHYRGAMLLGATTAYDKRLQTFFGDLQRSLLVEDVPLTVRAAMLGRVAYLDDRLVDYRVGIHGWLPNGGKAETFHEYQEVRRFKVHADETVANQILSDAIVTNDPAFIGLASARQLEVKYAAAVTATRRPHLRQLMRAILATRRALPSLAIAVLMCSESAEKLYFWLSRRFRPIRDPHVFRRPPTHEG